jgi:hypothetical protein
LFILDQPYISDFLLQTSLSGSIPLLRTTILDEAGLGCRLNVLDSADAVKMIREKPETRIYTNSENAIAWMSENLAFTSLPEKIALFKNKVRFRDLISPQYPEFYYREVQLNELQSVDPTALPYPVVIKPAVGFFSVGVHKVHTAGDWQRTVAVIAAELEQVRGLYPEQVMNGSSFIIEECFPGEEFAIDAYYNSQGRAVILNIHKHLFSSDDDVSDRVYLSSKDIILDHLEGFTQFLDQIGALAEIRSFPVHVELRKQSDGALVPVEVNPMRFGGWCSTGDAAWLAYGLNPYTAYLQDEIPDWDSILKGKDGLEYGLVILDNSTGIDGNDIESFDYEAVERSFERVLELRKIDYKVYPVFGFVFVETRVGDRRELDRILRSDLKEYIR